MAELATVWRLATSGGAPWRAATVAAIVGTVPTLIIRATRLRLDRL